MPSSQTDKDVEQPVQQPQKEYGLEDLAGLMENDRDPREKAFVRLVELLYDPEKLLMIARLKTKDHIAILRNFIIVDFFVDYYSMCQVKFKLESITKPPFYKKSMKIDYPKDKKSIEKKYKEFIDKVMMITISAEGLGRSEAIEALKPMNESLNLKERLSSFVKR